MLCFVQINSMILNVLCVWIMITRKGKCKRLNFNSWGARNVLIKGRFWDCFYEKKGLTEWGSSFQTWDIWVISTVFLFFTAHFTKAYFVFSSENVVIFFVGKWLQKRSPVPGQSSSEHEVKAYRSHFLLLSITGDAWMFACPHLFWAGHSFHHFHSENCRKKTSSVCGVFVCVCACMHICKHVCVHVYLCVCVFACGCNILCDVLPSVWYFILFLSCIFYQQVMLHTGTVSVTSCVSQHVHPLINLCLPAGDASNWNY